METTTGGSTGTSAKLPPAGTRRALLRKSSSASLLDTSGGGNGGGGNDGGGASISTAFPKLNRRSGSLKSIDVQDAAVGGAVGESKKKTKRSKTAKADRAPKTGWNTPSSMRTTTLPALPVPDPAALATDYRTGTLQDLPQISRLTQRSRQQHKRRRRAGDIILTRPATIEVVVKYQLGQYELKKFKACFNQIDLDSSGVIDYDEFFEFIDETKTPFSEGLFRMIDADSNGTIDYEEFVHAMVLYCMHTRDEILHFAFDTFDPAKTGSIGEKEFKRLISLVNDGKPIYPGNFKNALTEFDRNKDGVLDFEEFKIMNKRYPMLLFPCFRLQDRMQKSTLGEHHWLRLHKRLYQRLKLENYQRKHNGAMPALGFVGSVKKFFGLDYLDVYEP